MVNKNYAKGRAKEYQVCEKLRKEGWEIVQRTAGSHSPIDVIAINKLTRVIKFIQCKPKSLSKKKKKEIEIKLNWLNNIFRVEFEVV